jgi:acyl-CoA reductase-like NAD-dependent aldehyde dehydrogenase
MGRVIVDSPSIRGGKSSTARRGACTYMKTAKLTAAVAARRAGARTARSRSRTPSRLRLWLATRSVRFQAEMGGKNASVVLADADLEAAAAAVVAAAFGQAGQRCTATSRLRCYVSPTILAEVDSRMDVWRHGGFRDSGSPFKEQGAEALHFYTRVKTVAIRYG